MSFLDTIFIYLSHSSAISIVVLIWLSIYFLGAFSILISRYIYLSGWENREQASLDAMLMGAKTIRNDSILKQCCSNSASNSKKIKLLDVCIKIAEKNATNGLSWLSIIASTSPFVGLFGTVVSILETFSKLGNASSASLSVIAPAIGEALVATACGIFVAIPAYTFHALLRRRGYLIISIVQRQADIVKVNMAEEKDLADL